MAACPSTDPAAFTCGKPDSYQTFADQLRAHFKPGSALEELAFARYTRAAWNSRRLEELQTELLDTPDLAHDLTTLRTLDLLSRQVARHERTMRESMRDFEQHKTERLDAYDEYLARAATRKAQPNDAPRPGRRNAVPIATAREAAAEESAPAPPQKLKAFTAAS